MADEKRAIIDQAQQQRMTRDTLILQKVNAAHREAFKTRFPGQVEHCMRLTAERLHQLLVKKPEDLGNPDTWLCSTGEIRDLAHALHMLVEINNSFPTSEE